MNCTWLCVPSRPSRSIRRLSVCLSGRLATPTVCICNTSLHFLCPVFIKDAHSQSTLCQQLHSISIAISISITSCIHIPESQHQVPLAAAVWHFCGGGCGAGCGFGFWFRFPFRIPFFAGYIIPLPWATPCSLCWVSFAFGWALNKHF